MGWDKHKNDVRTIFFIFNTFSAVGVGLIFFSFGVATGVFQHMKPMDIVDLVLGVMSAVVIGLMGYCGAMAENKKMLRFYYVVMFARSVYNVIWLVIHNKFDADMITVATGRRVSADDLLETQIGFFGFVIIDTILTMVTALLAMTLAANANQETNNQQVRVAKAVC